MKSHTSQVIRQKSKSSGSGSSTTNYQLSTTNSSRGFSLVELLVVIAIVAVVSALVLARYGQFNGQVLLRNLAYDIALSVRQAQVYTISGKAGISTNGVPYGVHFKSIPNTQYYIFADNNGNGAYDTGEETEVLTVRSGYSITNFCGDLVSGTSDCVLTGQITTLTILFKRPDPDAYIKTSRQSTGYRQARVVARSPTGNTRTITITLTGQIAIEQAN